MIRINKNFDQPPAALQSAEVLEAIKVLIETGNQDAIVSDLYRGKTVLANGTVKFTVVEKLMKLYHDKCAYCESKEFDPQVEHYRPKKRVVGAAGHHGYFWLAFIWSNLVSTCFDCNKIGRGKGNRFPLLGGEALRLKMPPLRPDNSLDTTQTRSDRPPLSLERPSLLHPEIDHPEQCFSFNSKGKMKGIDAESRGAATIMICNLNRHNLLFRRKKALDNFVHIIRDAFLAFGADEFSSQSFLTFMKFTLTRMKEWGNPAEEYSLYGTQALNNFTTLVIPLLPKAARPTALEIFERFRSGQL